VTNIPLQLHDLDVRNWPRRARAINNAAARIHAHYGDEGIPADVLKQEAARRGEYILGSVLPQDYCYNFINKASYSFLYPIFVRIGRGRYKYVGPGYAYTGPVMWKPHGQKEQQVGWWSSGVCTLETDPRRELSGASG
jgi:hypothetical protein